MSEQSGAKPTLTRRSFLKTTGAVAGAAAVVGGAGTLTALAENAKTEGSSGEEVVYTVCRSNCFQRCLLEAHVRDGKLCYMSRGDYPEDIYSGCCLKGLSMHERTYSPTRIKYPMRRVDGTERGANQWERIEWDEAIAEIAKRFTEIQEKYGKRAVAVDTGSGNYCSVQGSSGVKMLFARALESTILNVCYDQSFGYGTDRVIGGGIWKFSNEPKNMLWSKNILIWGANPVSAQPQTWRIAQFAKERGAKITCIDPMFSMTAARCNEYVPIKAGTDVLVSLAILNEIVSKDQIDREYVLANTTAPFLIRKDNGLLLRRSDVEGGDQASVRDAKTLNTVGQMKQDPAYVIDEATGEPMAYTSCDKPALEGTFTVAGIEVETVYSALKEHVSEYTVERASEASGIPADKILELSKMYAEDGPVFLYSIYGIDHYRNGHLFSQTMAVVHALTNNISRRGSSIGGSGGVMLGNLPLNWPALNPVSGKTAYTDVPQVDLANTIATGKHKGEDYPIKALFFAYSNALSNYAQQKNWFDVILPNIDFIVTVDTEMTDTALHSDMILPVISWVEANDFAVSNYANPFVSYAGKAVEPLYEAKPDTEIYALIAEKMGFGDDVPHRTPEEWIDVMLDTDGMRKLGITQETLKKEHAFRGVASENEPMVRVAYGESFPTPSGRAELYKELPLPRVDYGQEWEEDAAKEKFPSFKPPTENWYKNDLTKKYPISYLSTHERWRVHSQWFNVQTLKELNPEPVVYLSPEDAEERAISDGDIVEVFNDRGSVTIKAVINNACPKGVLDIPKGWQRGQVIDGGYQTMTGAESDPLSINFAYFDALVDVRKK